MYRTAAILRVPPDPQEAPTGGPSPRPVRVAADTTATSGGALVAVTLHNDTDVDVRVRVENDLDGPVLPPRREGVPAAGWDAEGFTGTVPANSDLGIGYACPCRGEPPDGADPISVDVLGPADEDPASTPDRVAAAVRSLGRSTPPADAVPVPAAPAADPDATGDGQDRRREAPRSSGTADPPAPIVAWLDTVEERVGRAERLVDATADEAAAILDACGGVDGVATLPDDLERDLASLRKVGDRIEALATRADAADPGPVASSLAAAAGGDRPTSGSDGEKTAMEEGKGGAPSDAGRPR